MLSHSVRKVFDIYDYNYITITIIIIVIMLIIITTYISEYIYIVGIEND